MSGGFGFFGGLIALVVAIVNLVALAEIIRKAGYSRWWLLIAFVPIANIIALWQFAFKEWPLERLARQSR